MRRLSLVAFALIAAVGLAQAADAKKLYKLVDRQGRVTYVDTVPKGFQGEVTEIAIDAPATPAPPAANPPPSAPRGPAAEGSAKRDINTERREARARLQAALDRAREKLAAAKKAQSEGGDIADDEFQVIQQHVAMQKNVPAPRPNCFQPAGSTTWTCPVSVAGEKYRDRQKALSDAVQSAEAEVAAAEDAYRRGTD